jgi:hypothetical protein
MAVQEGDLWKQFYRNTPKMFLHPLIKYNCEPKSLNPEGIIFVYFKAEFGPGKSIKAFG